MKAIPILKKAGYYDEEILDNSGIKIFVAFIIGLMVSGVIFYGIQTNSFKSEINQDVQIEPNIQVNSTTNNDYQFDPQIDNKYTHNITVYVNNFIECNGS